MRLLSAVAQLAMVGFAIALLMGAGGPVTWQMGSWKIVTGLSPALGILLSISFLAGLLVAVSVRPPASLGGASGAPGTSWLGWADNMTLPQAMAAFAVIFLIVAVIAARTDRLALVPMTIGLAAGGGAVVAARHTAVLLAANEKLELKHDIVGIGGGLGGWRLSRAGASALLVVFLGAAAVALSTAGLHQDKPAAEGEKKADGDNKTGSPERGDQPEAGVKKAER